MKTKRTQRNRRLRMFWRRMKAVAYYLDSETIERELEFWGNWRANVESLRKAHKAGKVRYP